MERAVVIAGASLAGLSAARELRKHGFTGRITTVDSESDAPYRRPAVSKALLSGAQTHEQARIPWPEELDLTRVPGVRLSSLDIAGHRISGTDLSGRHVDLDYDDLVIATGARARAFDVGPAGGDVLTLRSAADARVAEPRLAAADSIAIIGAGFIGLEVASVASAMGKRVTVVEAAAVPLAHAMGADLGQHVAQIHAQHGVQILCGVQVLGLVQVGDKTHVLLGDTTLEVDLVVAAVGSQPEVEWLEGSGLDISHGVVCSERCRPSGVDNIVVAGDVASWFNPLYRRQMRVEHWTNALEQGSYAARELLHVAPDSGFSSAPYFWSEQYDVRIQSVGSSFGHDEVVVIEKDRQTFTIAYGRQGTLVGVAGVNCGPILARYRKLIEQRVSISTLAA